MQMIHFSDVDRDNSLGGTKQINVVLKCSQGSVSDELKLFQTKIYCWVPAPQCLGVVLL